MLTDDKLLYIASADGREICLEPSLANRHGLVAGATGTGKTVTVMNLAESFSSLGVPVFLTDVKGDLAGLSQPGQPTGGLATRVEELHLPGRGYRNQAFPVCFWDVLAAQGHPLRATVASLGPLLLARLLDLNEVQSGVLNLTFKAADDEGLLLLDFKDLRQMVSHVGDNAAEYRKAYGNVSPASIGAIQRALLRLESEGVEHFFGEPSLALEDLFLTDLSGRGYLNILAADQIINSPRLYATVLMWLLSDLYDRLPEVGDLERPRLILMFDEAHLLFTNTPQVLVQKMEQVMRLIRSKGVGVYFCTQNPADLPTSILGQLGNRVQHALRAYTPQDQKGVRAAAQTFRPNPAFKTEEAITTLATGEALVSFLNRKGEPNMVERAKVLPPESRTGAITADERRAVMKSSRLAGRYEQIIDRESAYELLAAKYEKAQQEADAARAEKNAAEAAIAAEKEARRRAKDNPLTSIVNDVTKQASRTLGREVGRSIVRGILGGLFGKK